MADSQQTSFSSSESNPVFYTSPLEQMLAQLSAAIGSYTFGWAQNAIQQTGQITQQVAQQFDELAAMGQGLANTIIQQYNSTFGPQLQNWIQQAALFGSPEYQNYLAGKAESTVAQSETAARNAVLKQLAAYGVNPNDGRTAEVLASMRAQDAAARAGAGTEAAWQSRMKGIDMTGQTINWAQNLPAMATNELNQVDQSVNAKIQAWLAAMNSSANALGAATGPLGVAASAARPIEGQTSQSRSGSQGGGGKQQQPRQPTQQQGGGGGGQGVLPTRGASTATTKPVSPNFFEKQDKQDDGSGDSDAGIGTMPGGYINPEDWANGVPGILDPSATSTDQLKDYTTGFGEEAQLPTPAEPWAPIDTNFNAPSPAGADLTDFSGGLGGQDNTPLNPTVPEWTGGALDTGDTQTAFDPNLFDPNLTDPNASNMFDPNAGQTDLADLYGFDPFDTTPVDTAAYDPSAGVDPNATADPYYDASVDAATYDTSGDYYAAQGGRIPPRKGPTTGGAVPRSASPSRGRVTDDIPARLNAGEFVIPRDVTGHLGSKYFMNLIKKSRQARGVGPQPIGAKMKPALNQRPTFKSRPMGR